MAFLALGMLAACGDDSSSTAPETKKDPIGQNGITVISPNGGESFQVGGKIPVRWNAAGSELTGTIRIRIRCGTVDWYELTGNSISNNLGDTALVIKDSVYNNILKKMIPLPVGNSCKVMVQDYFETYLYDTSDVAFTVIPK
jgi:hypothetical protein